MAPRAEVEHVTHARVVNLFPRTTQVGRDKLDSLVFVSSNFLRARQTAEECRAALLNILSFEREASRGDEGADGDEARMPPGASIGGYDVSPPVVIRHELRERSFGELDATTLVNYNKVPFFHRRGVLVCLLIVLGGLL